MAAEQRLVRGSLAAGVSTSLALSSHLLAGGDPPATAGVVVPFVLSWCACVALASWRDDALRLTVSVVVSQALFHGLFVLGSAGGAPDGHVHPGSTGLGPAGRLAESGVGPLMWLAHLAAAAVTVLALRSGEQALARLARSVADLVRRPVLPATDMPAPPAPREVRPFTAPAAGGGLGRFALHMPRRGPPASARLR